MSPHERTAWIVFMVVWGGFAAVQAVYVLTVNALLKAVDAKPKFRTESEDVWLFIVFWPISYAILAAWYLTSAIVMLLPKPFLAISSIVVKLLLPAFKERHKQKTVDNVEVQRQPDLGPHRNPQCPSCGTELKR